MGLSPTSFRPENGEAGVPCADFRRWEVDVRILQISYRWVHGFLIVGFRGIGWARLFYDLNFVLPLAAGLVAGLIKGDTALVAIS